MAAVRINSGPVEATDRLREVPREKWHDLMLARRQFMQIHLSHDCRCLVEFVNDAKLMFEALGFGSAEHMIREGYGLEPEEIGVAVAWLDLNPPDEPLALDQAISLGKRGRPKKGEEKGAIGTFNRGSNSRAYILARLDRDGHDELAANIRAGGMSANAAAIEAGFRKQATPLERIFKLLPKLTGAELAELAKQISAVRAKIP